MRGLIAVSWFMGASVAGLIGLVAACSAPTQEEELVGSTTQALTPGSLCAPGSACCGWSRYDPATGQTTTGWDSPNNILMSTPCDYTGGLVGICCTGAGTNGTCNGSGAQGVGNITVSAVEWVPNGMWTEEAPTPVCMPGNTVGCPLSYNNCTNASSAQSLTCTVTVQNTWTAKGSISTSAKVGSKLSMGWLPKCVVGGEITAELTVGANFELSGGRTWTENLSGGAGVGPCGCMDSTATFRRSDSDQKFNLGAMGVRKWSWPGNPTQNSAMCGMDSKKGGNVTITSQLWMPNGQIVRSQTCGTPGQTGTFCGTKGGACLPQPTDAGVPGTDAGTPRPDGGM